MTASCNSVPVFVVRLRAKRGRDPIKELRRLLKLLGRHICISAEQEQTP
jgi:hypothetical protein